MIPLLNASEEFGDEVDQQRALQTRSRTVPQVWPIASRCLLQSARVVQKASSVSGAVRWLSRKRPLSTLVGMSNLVPKCSYKSYSFPKAAVDTIVAEARATLTSGYISTDDVLSAFVWQSVSRARRKRLSPDVVTTLARSVNARRYLGIHEAYPGVVVNTAYSKLVVQDLIDMPLGSVAVKLREKVDPTTSNFGHYTRAVATLLSRSADKNVLRIIARLNFSTDLILTSGASISESLPLDFGLGLGSPVAVRVPCPSPLGLQSMVGFMPKSAQGDWTVGMCLRDDDLEHLETDASFLRYTACIESKVL
jgi:hypothetical protein